MELLLAYVMRPREPAVILFICVLQRSTCSELSTSCFTYVCFIKRLVYVFERAGALALLLSVFLQFHYMVDAYGEVPKLVVCAEEQFVPFVATCLARGV